MKKSTAAHSILMIVLCAQFLGAQQMIVRQEDATHAYPADSRVSTVFVNGTSYSRVSGGGDEVARYIIEMAPSSVFVPQSLNKSVLSDAAQRRSAVRRQLDQLTIPAQTLREYAAAISGFCVQTQRKNYSVLTALPGVRRVWEDLKVASYPVAASSAITIPASSAVGSATGKGIRIGIIDTGIDYLHEALGGGFGPAFKVCGGYDFVNNDPDPMDDNGHGTHVAGIIAGDSKTMTGMAVGASIYSYKALDASGQGYVSSVIAAIERAMQDSVKVINLSLGTSDGDPDDILSQAVDNAAASGIVVVAAAGNAGEFGTIDSPGAARGALTVGAVDSKNIIASFSSKGPTQKNFGMKPDVVAPGVSILSAKLGGGYVAMSGTSMSAPYVAGVAAAAAELHPSWSAGQIRNAITESALPLVYDHFTAGSGRVDPLRAAGIHTVADPASMSLGFNTTAAPSWSKRETLYVVNTNPTTQRYSLSSSASSPAIRVSLIPASLELAPNERAAVLVEIAAANGLLADNRTLTEAYSGMVTAISPLDTVRVPFTFFKGTMLQVQFDEIPWQVIIHDRKNKQYSFQPKTANLAVVLPSGTYDIVSTFFPSTYVVRESVQTTGLVELVMKKAEAVHPVRLVPTDEAGNRITADQAHEVYSSIEGLVHRASGVSMISMGGGAYTAAQSNSAAFVSDLSDRYVFGYTLNIQQGNATTYTYDAALETGITDSATIVFAAGEAVPLEVRYDVDSSNTRSIFPIVWSCIYLQGQMVRNTYYDGTSASLPYPFTQRSFYFKRSSTSFPVFHYREAYKY